MHDQGHAGFEHGVHVFQNVRLGVGKHPHAVAAHARPLARGVFAETVFTEHVVLGLRDVGGARAGTHRGDARLQRLGVDRERAPLRLIRLAHHQRAADLGEIALHRGCEFRGDEIADRDLAL